jgi:hypothetical protein
MLAPWAQKWKGECGARLSDVWLLFTKETETGFPVVMVVFWLRFEGPASGWFAGQRFANTSFRLDTRPVTAQSRCLAER